MKKMLAIVLCIILTAGLFTVSLAADTAYYVDATAGNDSNPGTLAAPWKTISKVNSVTFSPGDTILFKCGESWTTTLLTPSSGTSDSYITYGAYGTGSKPIIRGLNVTGKSYVVVQDIEFKNDSNDYPVFISGSNHIRILDCNIFADTNNTSWAALDMQMNSNYNEISGCSIEHRNLTRQADAVNMKRNANYNLIKDNYIGKATHYSLNLEGSNVTYPDYTCNYNIIQGNTIYNPEGAMVEFCSNSNNNVFERNNVSGGKSTSFCNNKPCTLKNVSMNNIIRYNILHDNPSTNSDGINSLTYRYTKGNLLAGLTPSTNATSPFPTNISYTTNGNKTSGNYADLGTGIKWITFDLGQSKDVNDIKVWHCFSDGRTYHDVIVQLSNQPDFSSGVTTVFNNDTDNTAGQGNGSDSEYAEKYYGKDIPFTTVNARYIRLWSNGSTADTSSHYVEVAAYLADPVNVATYNYTYNNDIINIAGYPIFLGWSAAAGEGIYYNYYKNNIVSNGNSTNNYQLSIWDEISVIHDNYFTNNNFYKLGVTNVYRFYNLNHTDAYSVDQINSSDPTHFLNNIQQDPQLDSDFCPVAGSPCIDGGDYLTKTTSTGKGTIIPVRDPGCFTNGFGLITGDTISVGGKTAVVVSVDLTAKTLTLDRSITWRDGTFVTLPFNGSKPDIGALERLGRRQYK